MLSADQFSFCWLAGRIMISRFVEDSSLIPLLITDFLSVMEFFHRFTVADLREYAAMMILITHFWVGFRAVVCARSLRVCLQMGFNLITPVRRCQDFTSAAAPRCGDLFANDYP